jgi:hypothetical protein
MGGRSVPFARGALAINRQCMVGREWLCASVTTLGRSASRNTVCPNAVSEHAEQRISMRALNARYSA